MTIDSRLSTRQNDGRSKTRASEDRSLTESRATKDGSLSYAIQLAQQQGQLPVPPERPGFSRIYLSTENKYDSIYSRMQMGYKPVKVDELPEDFRGFTSNRSANGFEGCFQINEMVLCEIEDEKRQQIREYLEHTAPMEQEERLRDTAAMRSSKGHEVGIDLNEFENAKPPASFEG